MSNRSSKESSAYRLQTYRSKFVWYKGSQAMPKCRDTETGPKQLTFESLKSEHFNFCVNCRSKSIDILNGEYLLCYRSLIMVYKVLDCYLKFVVCQPRRKRLVLYVGPDRGVDYFHTSLKLRHG